MGRRALTHRGYSHNLLHFSIQIAADVLMQQNTFRLLKMIDCYISKAWALSFQVFNIHIQINSKCRHKNPMHQQPNVYH